MRNKITLIIILVSIILLAIVMFHGVNIGNFEILSISQLKEKNDSLDNKIDKASKLTSVDYPENVETLEKSFEEYTIKKEKYKELTDGSIGNIEEIYETKQYDISYLWRVLGKYAEKRNLTLGINVQSSNKNNGTYNFNFTVLGQYVDIIRFITDIENDSDLYFRIYNFRISGSSTLTATFTVTDINIDESTIKDTKTSSMTLSNEAD